MDHDQERASRQEAARARRRASIAEAFVAVTQGPRIPITERMTVPLRLLCVVQQGAGAVASSGPDVTSPAPQGTAPGCTRRNDGT